MMVISGLCSLAGLGGGGPNITILIMLFGIQPKDATIMVFACVFGSASGNMINQMRRSLDDEPVVLYSFASIAIPLMFIGTLFGVLINKLLPSLITVLIIVAVSAISLPKVFMRFLQ